MSDGVHGDRLESKAEYSFLKSVFRLWKVALVPFFSSGFLVSQILLSGPRSWSPQMNFVPEVQACGFLFRAWIRSSRSHRRDDQRFVLMSFEGLAVDDLSLLCP